MSGMAHEENPALQGPRRGFIEKPFTVEALRAALDGLLADPG